MKIFNDESKEDGATLFSVTTNKSTGDNRHRMTYKKSCLKIGKCFLWSNKFSRSAMKSPSVKILKPTTVWAQATCSSWAGVRLDDMQVVP